MCKALVWTQTLIGFTIVTLGAPQLADRFSENWDGPSSAHFSVRTPAGARVLFNIAQPSNGDGRVLQLELPANPISGPGGGPEIQTRSRCLYGHFSTRLKTADSASQPKAGVVTGYFTYFNDGKDYNNNGLPDNSEIDFEWLAAQPEVVYMTLWTDYRDRDAAQRRVGRAVNLRTGQILYTCYFEGFGQCQPLSGAEAEPTAIAGMPGYNSAAGLYDYGFDWAPTGVTWWMTDPGTGRRLVLWDYRGPAARIPSVPAYFMTNVWYTSGWYPDGMPEAIERPVNPMSIFVDWTRYRPNSRSDRTESRQRGRRASTRRLRPEASFTSYHPESTPGSPSHRPLAGTLLKTLLPTARPVPACRECRGSGNCPMR